MAGEDRRTDEEIVEDFLDGDTASFRALIERHHDPLLHFLVRLTGKRHLAEDVFQDTFLQVHQSIESFDTARRFKPWLFTIAANKARDALRKVKRRPAVSLSAGIGGNEDAQSYVDLMQIDIPAPGEGIEETELSELVQEAVDTLTPRMREVLLLAYFQRMTYAQIAEVCGIPVGTVKSRLHAAVAAFAKAWQSQQEQRSENAERARDAHNQREHG